MPTVTVIITLNLDCCRWRKKIERILCCIQARTEFVFEKVEYEKDKVILSGPFDADKLSCMLRCKAGCLIKNIKIVEPPPPPPLPPKECKLIPCPYPCPYPWPQPAWPCSCSTPRPCQGHCRPPAPPPEPSACRCPTWMACRCRCCCRGMPCPLVIIIEDRPVPPCVIM